jgi:hypothetical protein
MAEHDASAAGGLRARAAVYRPRTAEVTVQHLGVGNAAAAQGYWRTAAAQGYWRRHRRAFCDSIARDYERETVCR